jgi:hypothetical protein
MTRLQSERALGSFIPPGLFSQLVFVRLNSRQWYGGG